MNKNLTEMNNLQNSSKFSTFSKHPNSRWKLKCWVFWHLNTVRNDQLHALFQSVLLIYLVLFYCKKLYISEAMKHLGSYDWGGSTLMHPFKTLIPDPCRPARYWALEIPLNRSECVEFFLTSDTQDKHCLTDYHQYEWMVITALQSDVFWYRATRYHAHFFSPLILFLWKSNYSVQSLLISFFKAKPSTWSLSF